MSRLHARRQFVAVGLSLALAVPLSAVAATSAVASDSGSGRFVLLRHGDDGPRVGLAQRALSVKPVNAHFNRKTRHAVRKFQDARGMAVTGVINERTMNGLQNKWANIQNYRENLNAKYHRIMKVARAQRGDPYRYGAAGPGAFDCSGYTMFVYGRATNISLQHLASAQYRYGHRISHKQARPGDLVFFYDGGGIYHTSIYAGHGRIWHSPHTGSHVKRDRIWTSHVYYARMFKKR
ncbi:MAG TPA: NlpC/P60 family protein [Actinomycetes bacterium]|nr:NlpC/P60 family protein [Actinomycetes bacterium]